MQAEPFETHRPKLFGIAYRMLGTVAEAEDAVQDTYLRWQAQTDQGDIKNIEAYLVTITTRLCIDQLKSARATRESYIGPWLPEPLIESPDKEPAAQQELAETLSYAFMLLLEQLNPIERAVYILREAFDFKHREIADVLNRTPQDSRQLSRRAKQHLKEQEARFQPSTENSEELFKIFLDAALSADIQGLIDYLADDIELHSDGGGKVRAALKVLKGKERVIQFMQRVMPQQPPATVVSLCRVNGQPAIKQTLDGKTSGIITMQFVDGLLAKIFIVRNPDKLAAAELEQRIS